MDAVVIISLKLEKNILLEKKIEVVLKLNTFREIFDLIYGKYSLKDKFDATEVVRLHVCQQIILIGMILTSIIHFRLHLASFPTLNTYNFNVTVATFLQMTALFQRPLVQ